MGAGEPEAGPNAPAARLDAVLGDADDTSDARRRGGVVGELIMLTFLGARATAAAAAAADDEAAADTGVDAVNAGGWDDQVEAAEASASPPSVRGVSTEKLASCAPTTMMSYSRLPLPPSQALRSTGGSALPTFHVHTSMDSLDMVTAAAAATYRLARDKAAASSGTSPTSRCGHSPTPRRRRRVHRPPNNAMHTTARPPPSLSNRNQCGARRPGRADRSPPAGNTPHTARHPPSRTRAPCRGLWLQWPVEQRQRMG